MKDTYTILFAASLAVAASVTAASAQSGNTRRGNIEVQMNTLAQRGDSLFVDMNITTEGRNISSRMSADFTPILTSDGHSKELPKVSVMGRNNYKNYRREQALMSKKEKTAYEHYAPHAVVRDYKGGQQVNYNLAVPYEPWMSSAQLTLRKDDCGCGKSRTTDTRLLANKVNLEKIIIIERYNITPSLAYMQPVAETVKQRAEQGTSYLDFAVGKTTINPVFGGNAVELDKIRQMIELVRNDHGVTIKQISIDGYASPEGSQEMNRRLSELRAKALQGYLQNQYPEFPQSLYSVHFGGENWDDLATNVRASDMSDKEAVLEIIDRVAIESNREAKLMALKGGAPWRYMLKEMFPALRKVTVEVDYNVKNFDLSEAKEVAKTRPQNLSMNEMYLVVNACEPGSQEYNDLFETAVRLFPNDLTANLNAAVAALGRKDYVSADRYLKNIKTKSRIPEYDNAMGVLVMMRDADYTKAEGYFKSAQQAGISAATQNLEEIAKMRKNLDQIKEGELRNK